MIVLPDVAPRMRAHLLGYSREAIARAIEEGRGAHLKEPEVPYPQNASQGESILDRPYGLFVTLRLDDALRGCIGRITTEQPLRATLPVVSVDAAIHDHRFPPLTSAELPHVTIEHSILTPPAAIAAASAFVPGRDGIILTLGHARSVFLPEVATEQGWDAATTLSALSRKAGLPTDAWQRPDATFMVFRTLHYGERDGEPDAEGPRTDVGRY